MDCSRFTEQACALVARLVLAGLLSLSSACHNFSAYAAPLDGGSSDALPACVYSGTCDDAGLPVDCSAEGPNIRDCDHSTLTYCESDTTMDPVNCGQCESPCAGLCAGESCSALERILAWTPEVRSLSLPGPMPSDRIAFTSEDIYVLTDNASATEKTQLHLIPKSQPAKAQTLLTGLSDGWSRLVVGNNRLYMLEYGHLFSVGLKASESPRDEKLDVDDYVIDRDILYWFDGSAFQRRDLKTGVSEVLFTASDGDAFGHDAHVMANAHTIVLGRSSRLQYELRFFSQNHKPAGQLTGDGVITKLVPSAQTDVDHDVFVWLSHPSFDEDAGTYETSPEHPDTIVEQVLGGEATIIEAGDGTIHDVAVDKDYVYSAWENGRMAGLSASGRKAGLRTPPLGLALEGTCGAGTLDCSVYFTDGSAWWRLPRNDLLR